MIARRVERASNEVHGERRRGDSVGDETEVSVESKVAALRP
jgi:hypothetical protein